MKPPRQHGMPNSIDPRSLRAFRAILRLGSVTLAAREMGLTQPSTSRLLAQLEQQVGFELFNRDRGRLIPTPDGLLIFEEVDRALDGIDRVSDLARDIAEFQIGQLKLVAPPSLLEGVLPDIVAKFLKRHPRIRITIDSPSVEAAKAMIATRAVDAGFVKRPLDRPDLRGEAVLISETACVVPRGMSLANNAIIHARMLRGVPLILLGLGRSSRARVEAAFADAGVVPQVRVETHTVSSACALAARGVGVAVVTESLAVPYVREGTVLRRFEPSITHEYDFVTSASASSSRLTPAFLELTHEHVAALQRANLSVKP